RDTSQSPVLGGSRPTPPRRHEGGLSGDGLRHGRAPPSQPGGAGQGGLDRLLHIDRPIDPEHQSFWQFCDTRRRARGLGWLADKRASKPCARPGWTPPVWMSSGGSARRFKCSCGRTLRTFQWASIGKPPPTVKACSTCCPVALRYSMGSAELNRHFPDTEVVGRDLPSL